MDTNYRFREKVVGLFFVAMLIIAFATLVLIGRGKNWFRPRVEYFTSFKESYNLQAGASVKLYNTEIGKVEEILLATRAVVVRLSVWEEYAQRIRRDSVAAVKSPTIIGSEYISVTAGTFSAPVIPPNGLIKSKEKKSISDVMQEFELEKTAKKVIAAAQDVSDLAKLLAGEDGPIYKTLNQVERATANLEGLIADVRSGKGTVGGLLESDDLLNDLKAAMKQVEAILGLAAKTAAKLPKITDTAGQTVSSVNRTMGDVRGNLKKISQILDQVQSAVAALQVVLENARKGSYDIPEITQSTREGIHEIRKGLQNVDKVVQSVQKNILIRPYLPPAPKPEALDAEVRP